MQPNAGQIPDFVGGWWVICFLQDASRLLRVITTGYGDIQTLYGERRRRDRRLRFEHKTKMADILVLKMLVPKV